jgi:hypothetical protein
MAASAWPPLARVRVLGKNLPKDAKWEKIFPMGSFDPLKIGLYVLLLLPGFIFVQVLEFHLLREEKPQFEKTLEIILASAFLWVVAIAIPWWVPWPNARALVLQQGLSAIQTNQASKPLDLKTLGSIAEFFFSVCLWTFLLVNVWGAVRKSQWADAALKVISGRDWYPSVALRFFDTNINRAVVVTTENRRVMGILFSAPDRKGDAHIVLTNVSRVPAEGENGEIEALPLVESLLIRLDEVVQIEALSSTVLQQRAKTS